MGTLFTILISTIFVENYVFAQFLGICPFFGVSSKTETATGMGLAVTFVVVLSSIITFVLHHYVLVKFGIEYLQTIVFILVIASLVQFVEMAIRKISPALYSAMGVFLPLITTNCMVLGVAVLNIDEEYKFIEMLFNSLGASIGFFLALILLAAVREEQELSDIPKPLEGVPIAMISAGLMAIAFGGFAGLV